MAAKKARSGRNIAEAERHTRQRKLRLPPDVDDMIDARAMALSMNASAYVAALVRRDAVGA